MWYNQHEVNAMDTGNFAKILNGGLESNAFPCYAAAVGDKDRIIFRALGGARSIYPERKELEEGTLFDMASLSKLIATTMAALRLIEKNRLSLDDKIGDFFENCYGKENTTVFELMTHTSGIKAHFPLWLRGIAPSDAADEILRENFGYTPKTDAVYSCMGYILLGRILEIIENEPLDSIVSCNVLAPLGMKNSFYNPNSEMACAATERDCDSGEIICGKVHDENARFLNGVAGNAGLFCDLDDCIRFARMLSMRGEGFISTELFDYAVTDLTPSFNEHRGLGFQIVGKRYGHNGFTGTSIYVHRESGVFAILLTNRVHPTRDNRGLFAIRNEFHKAVFGE